MLPAVAALSLSMVLSPLSPMSLSRPLAPTRAEHALPQYESLGMLSAAAQLTPKEVTVTGGVMNVVLAGIKAAAGLATGSASLIADAGHSFSDLLSDGLCMLAASKPAYEQICTRGIGLMLLSAGGAMIVSSATMIATTLPRAAASNAHTQAYADTHARADADAETSSGPPPVGHTREVRGAVHDP